MAGYPRLKLIALVKKPAAKAIERIARTLLAKLRHALVAPNLKKSIKIPHLYFNGV